MRHMTEMATLGGGCFWCLEAVYQQVRGVLHVTSGFAGGHVLDPTYEQVCTGQTGHAEVVQVEFDPEVIGYSEILDVFFAMHDPTTLNRQGYDTGSEYRSIILTHSAEQRELAESAVDRLEEEGIFDDEIVTEIAALDRFYPAEEDHQDFYARNPRAGYCVAVINPKLSKLREKLEKLISKS